MYRASASPSPGCTAARRAPPPVRPGRLSVDTQPADQARCTGRGKYHSLTPPYRSPTGNRVWPSSAGVHNLSFSCSYRCQVVDSAMILQDPASIYRTHTASPKPSLTSPFIRTWNSRRSGTPRIRPGIPPGCCTRGTAQPSCAPAPGPAPLGRGCIRRASRAARRR